MSCSRLVLTALALLWASCGSTIPAPATADAVESLAAFLLPLVSTEPADDASAPDLAALAGWLGEARVVGLGESLHGVHDFHRLGHRIFAHLVQTRGFDVFALEIDQAHAARLNEFVGGRRDDLDALLAERWWTAEIFYDQAVRDLLLWMREYNGRAERPVHFAGFDLKQPALAMRAVGEGLRRLDPAAAAKAESLYAPVRALPGFGVFPNVYGFTGSLRVTLPPRTETQTLRVALRVRGQGVSHGSVGLTVEGADPASPPLRKSRWLAAHEVGGLWAPLEVELPVPGGVGEVRLLLHHRGNGTVWFDGFFLELGGRKLELPDGLGAIELQPLQMPAVQVMDYRTGFDEQVAGTAGPSLRVDCDPAIDEILRAANDVVVLVREQVALHRERLSPPEAAWLQQMSRLVLQACEWRALAEPNRDVFLARNVSWLQREGFPGSRVFVLAHSSHTERLPRKMGAHLAAELGDAYKTVTMHALAGRYRYFGDVRSLKADGELELFSVAPDDVELLARRLGEAAENDLLFHLAGAAASAAGLRWLEANAPSPRPAADVLILVRRVSPILP